MDRRSFLKNSLLAVSAASTAPVLRAFAATPKRILVLGGTDFLGPAVVEAAVIAGHEVTLFNRGVTNPELFPRIEKLRGFRNPAANNEDLSALTRRSWDVVIDVWPHDPAMVASAATLLRDRVQHYLYVSSIAAYDPKNLKEAASMSPLRAPWAGTASEYARGKAEGERRLTSIVGLNLTIVRPGPIKGTRDDTPDLLTWLRRAQAGGKHIAPGDGSASVEIVDVKDVARFLMLTIDQSIYGTFNLTGKAMTFREFLDRCKAATHSGAEFVWIAKEFLDQHHLDPDSKLHTYAGNFPFWRPSGSSPGVYQVKSDKAFAAGWQTRPFAETALDCLASYRAGYGDLSSWSDYLSAEKEKEILDAWTHQAG